MICREGGLEVSTAEAVTAGAWTGCACGDCGCTDCGGVELGLAEVVAGSLGGIEMLSKFSAGGAPVLTGVTVRTTGSAAAGTVAAAG